MTAAFLREAAASARRFGTSQLGEDFNDARHIAVADWLDTAGADLWAHGPLHCADGCPECDDDLWMPHVRNALNVARAYLGRDS